MVALLVGFFFLLGTVLASFTGVLAGRLYTGQGVVSGRSRCDACGATLRALDLIPVVSYLASLGRARCCGARFSLLMPAAELSLGAAFAASSLRPGLSVALPIFLIALILLSALVLYDLAHQILPPTLLAPFVTCSALFAYVSAPSASALRLAAGYALVFAAFFALLWALSRGRAMGLADAPLVFGLGLLAGSTAPVGFLFSFWIGAIVGIALLALRRSGATMKSEVPFAPFLAFGFLLAYFTQWDPFAITATLAAVFGGGLS